MLICSVLAQLGMPVDDALRHIASYRGLSTLQLPISAALTSTMREQLVDFLAVHGGRFDFIRSVRNVESKAREN